MPSNFSQSSDKQQDKDQPLILVVDNDHDNLLFASCIIDALGMHYVFTDDSEECLNLVYQLLPDIILLDIVMPKIDGLEIIRIIKQDQDLPYIPIIAVTGLTRTQDKERLSEAGCDDYLCKPYMIEELESKIHGCLNQVLIKK